MLNFFSPDIRRNPYPVYAQLRSSSPLWRDPQSTAWMVFDYDTVKHVLEDHETFSSRYGPAEWMIFLDPPRQTRLRALVSTAFTPRSIANMELRIREMSRELLDRAIDRAGDSGVFDIASELAVPLPLMVIAAMLGIPQEDQLRFNGWNDAILAMSYTILGGHSAKDAAREAASGFMAATAEMSEYLAQQLAARKEVEADDLLTRLLRAEIDGQRLTKTEILGFFQLLLVAGQETTSNLINNAVLTLVEHPGELARLRASPELLPSAIEEVLRYCSPFQWMFRVSTRETELHGQALPAGSFMLAMIGSANRDPKHFPDPDRFDITREPNPHIAFGHGVHFCLGAALARLEARVALTEILERIQHFELAETTPWTPRAGLHVHGPSRLPIRFRPARSDVMVVG
jgi:cytochrome P450